MYLHYFLCVEAYTICSSVCFHNLYRLCHPGYSILQLPVLFHCVLRSSPVDPSVCFNCSIDFHPMTIPYFIYPSPYRETHRLLPIFFVTTNNIDLNFLVHHHLWMHQCKDFPTICVRVPTSSERGLLFPCILPATWFGQMFCISYQVNDLSLTEKKKNLNKEKKWGACTFVCILSVLSLPTRRNAL